MKTTKEMIEVMKWFDNGGEVEYSLRGEDTWSKAVNPTWDWYDNDYRIKTPKQKVIIEKWLIEGNDIKFVVETSDIDSWLKNFPTAKKIKLIERYEIEL